LRDDLTSEDEINPLIDQIGETVRINNILIANNSNGGNSSNMNIGSGAITFGGNITRQQFRSSKKKIKTSAKKNKGF
jgi:hypothetical protein